jgi:hypothetical protein
MCEGGKKEEDEEEGGILWKGKREGKRGWNKGEARVRIWSSAL